MKIDLIFIVVIGICIISYFCTSNNIENFDATSDAAEAAVKKLYQADVSAIRTLTDIATKLQTGGYTCPGKFGIGGMSEGMLNIRNPNGNYSHFGWVNNENYIRNKTTQDGELLVNGPLNVNGNTNVNGSTNVNGIGTFNSGGHHIPLIVRSNTDSHIQLTTKNDDGKNVYLINRDGHFRVHHHGIGDRLEVNRDGNTIINGNLAIPGYGNVKATLDNILSRLAAIEASYVKKDVRFRLQNTNVWEQGNSTFLNVVMSDACYLGVRGNSCGRANWGSSAWGGDDADFRIQQ